MTLLKNLTHRTGWALAVLTAALPLLVSAEPVQLHDAVKSGDVAEIRRLLEVDPDLVGTCDAKGNTPLHVAASLKETEIIGLLIGRGAEVNTGNRRGATPLHRAASAGNADVLRLLLEEGADVNAKTRSQWTALHSAVALGMKDVVGILIAHGADVNAMDEMDEAPLNIAVTEDHYEIAEILTAQGAVISEKRAPEIYEIAGGYRRITAPQDARPNVLVFSGPDGTLLVDSGRSETAKEVREAIEDIGADEVKFIINTHYHADHCGGNSVIGPHAILIDYGSLRDRVSNGLITHHKPAAPSSPWRLYQEYYSMRFNREEIRIIPAPGAHTQEDLIIHFVDSGIVQMGDLLFSESFPYLEGSLGKYVGILGDATEVFPASTIFVAGHGRECTLPELVEYRTMLQTTIDVVVDQRQAGKTLEELQQDCVLNDWGSWGRFLRSVTTGDWIETIYLNHHPGVRTAGLADRLQALLDGLVESEEYIRSGALLVEGPGFRWKGASGIAAADGQVPMLPDDQFVIDSIAKMMTSTLVMKLVESGRLGLDDYIGLYLPDSLMEGLHVLEDRSYGDEITVRHLLSHMSGFHDDWACPGFLDLIIAEPQRRWTPEETIEFVKANCEPRFAPGEGFHYSDTGYNMLGLIIERITGRMLHEAQRDLLFDPLGMDHTYRPSHEEARPVVPARPPSERYLDGMECTLWPAVMTADWAGGGLVSTTEDLNRFLRSFVKNTIFAEPTTKDEMFSWVESGPYHNYGFGISRVLFDLSDNPDHSGLGEIWGHAGSSYSFMFYWPRYDVTIVGTLNQLNVQQNRYDILASIMKAVVGTQ